MVEVHLKIPQEVENMVLVVVVMVEGHQEMEDWDQEITEDHISIMGEEEI